MLATIIMSLPACMLGVCVRACVRAYVCVRACVRACVCVLPVTCFVLRLSLLLLIGFKSEVSVIFHQTGPPAHTLQLKLCRMQRLAIMHSLAAKDLQQQFLVLQDSCYANLCNLGLALFTGTLLSKVCCLRKP